ncbi:MAG: guanylate kinase [Planctomycetota bacterium]|nr:guanylate kinase [Planctomycetota bacterium]
MGGASTGRQSDSGLLVVISGPSGVGKTTIARAVQQRFDALFSVSATTRPRSDQERDGVDYHFVGEDAFRSMIEAGELLEYAQVFGRDFYGTPRRPVEEAIAAGRIVLLDIDVQGAIQVRRTMPDAFLIFILPPGDEELLRRLRARKRDDEAAIRRRFEEAKREIDRARESGAYDAFVVNDDLEQATREAAALIRRRSADRSTTP